jgi:hypothetical protein
MVLSGDPGTSIESNSYSGVTLCRTIRANFIASSDVDFGVVDVIVGRIEWNRDQKSLCDV